MNFRTVYEELEKLLDLPNISTSAKDAIHHAMLAIQFTEESSDILQYYLSKMADINHEIIVRTIEEKKNNPA